LNTVKSFSKSTAGDGHAASSDENNRINGWFAKAGEFFVHSCQPMNYLDVSVTKKPVELKTQSLSSTREKRRKINVII
jgi:hypothetical protein